MRVAESWLIEGPTASRGAHEQFGDRHIRQAVFLYHAALQYARVRRCITITTTTHEHSTHSHARVIQLIDHTAATFLASTKSALQIAKTTAGSQYVPSVCRTRSVLAFRRLR